MNKIIKLIFLSVLFVCEIALANGRIDKINISGNQRIENTTIQEYSGLRVGQQFSPELQNDAIKKLYSTSLFDDIAIDFKKGVVNIFLKESFFISKVSFSGNYKVRSTILSSEILTAAGKSLKKSALEKDVEKIKEIYKRAGRFSVNVKSVIEKKENNTVEVIFQITEGPKTGIKSIHFSGNVHYTDSELKSVIMTKESRWFRFLETNDTYDPDRIEYDKYLLSSFYNSLGFTDFNVISVSADLLPTKEGFVLTYSIDEGAKYKFGNINVNNRLQEIKLSEIEKFIEQKSGAVFNYRLVESMAKKISDYLGTKGYPYVEVRPDIKPDIEEKTVDVVMVVDQAEKIFINRINISGNVKTEDQVIRRQIKLSEGDIYNREKVAKSENNIRNLNYFGNLMMNITPTDKKDRYDINVDVEEKSTATLGFDLGYNTTGGPFGRVSLLERNLLGTGKYLNLGVQAGKKNTSYYGGITDPHFLDKDLSFSLNLFKNQDGRGSGFGNGEQNYAKSSVGGSTSIGYDVTENLAHEVSYSLKKDKLSSASKSASRFIIEQMGEFTTSSIGHNLIYDRTDSRVVPKNGYLIIASQDFAGIGGDTKYLKHELDGKYYKSFAENKYTLKLAASIGDIRGVSNNKVRISDRFNLGGHSLRGFESGGIGPRDKSTNEGFGGQKYYSVSSELNFPVGLPEEFGITGAIFADAGSLWDADSKAVTDRGFYNDKSLRASVGFGFIWVTRVAPIRLDWGFPVKKKKYDEEQTFHIRFSTHL